VELDILAQRYGVMPSSIASQNVTDFSFNMLVASVGSEYQAKQADKARRKSQMRGNRGR